MQCKRALIVRKVLSKNNYLVQKIATDKTKIPHRMPFTPGTPIPDVQTTSQERKPDPDFVRIRPRFRLITWKTKNVGTKKQTFQNTKNAVMFMCNNLRQITKAINSFHRLEFNWALIVLSFENLFRKTITWYIRLQRIKHKSLIAWDYVRSRLEILHSAYKPHHKNGNQIPISSLNTKLGTPKHGNLFLEAYFWQRSRRIDPI